MHATLDLPILHIADCTALAIKEKGLSTVGLLGTEPTMRCSAFLAVLSAQCLKQNWNRDGSWLKSRLASHGVAVKTPTDPAVLRRCYDIICQELSFDIFKPESAVFFMDQIKKFQEVGCQGVILGCTEIELLITAEVAETAPIPVFRSAAIHIEAAAHVLAQKKVVADFMPPAETRQ